ncbi:hypothetical protein GIB67_021606, partial [Kingdonia uniflora]
MPFYFLTCHNFEVEIYSEHVEASTLFNSNSSDECSCFFEQVISYYFPLSQCNEGLKVLVQSLFGATFHSIPIAPSESWYYAWDYRFLRTFAKRYLTGEVIPEEVVESMKGARNMFTSTEYAGRRLTSLIALALNSEESFFDKVGALHASMAFLGLQHYP